MTDYLKNLGHDGIRDQGGKGGGEGHTVWIPFTGEQVKDSAPVTFDDAGNVIPLDERFDQGQQDIRHSVRDNEYMAAVNSGDMDTAQRLVDEAAREAGYDSPKLYHGTRAFGFTEFDLGLGEKLIFATSDEVVAETYSGKTNRRAITERAQYSAEKLTPEQLLEETKKILPERYRKLQLMSEEEKGRRLKAAQEALKKKSQIIREFMDENSGLFDVEKDYVVRGMAIDLETMASSKTDDIMFDRAYSSYHQNRRQFIHMDPTYADVLFNKLGSMSAISEAADMLYSGAIYTEGDKIVYENELFLKLDEDNQNGRYQLYGQLGNSLDFDAQGANWSVITPPEELNLSGKQRTRDIAAAAFDAGYDSVVIRNVKDNGGATEYMGTGTTYFFNAKNRVKSADPVTYDDAGNVIPLSERFNAEKRDVRYSLREFEDGRKFVDVDTDQKQFDGLTDKESASLPEKS